MATTIGSVSVSLSHRLLDSVASAGTDGETFSSAIRLQYIQDGQKTFWQFFYENVFKRLLTNSYDKFTDTSDVALLMRLSTWYPTVSKAADVSAVIDLSVADFANMTDVIKVFHADDFKNVTLVPKLEIGNVDDFTSRYYPSFLRPVAYVSGTNLYIKPADTNNKLKNFNITFIRSPDYTDGNSDTLLWDDTFIPDLISLAESHAYHDNGEPEKASAIQNRVFANYGVTQGTPQ